MSKQLLYLLDGMALAYRAHFAMISSNLKNQEGISTGPIFGFANMLDRLLESKQPTHIAVAWDTSEPTFRHEMDESYKANRPPQPEELQVGIPLIKEMVEQFGISNIEQDGYEADDIIGTIASKANAEDVDVFLVTNDKDFMQLVHDHIKLYKPLNNADGFEIVDREGVLKYFGVYPEQVIDVLAIIGDKSDNIPGVQGIGKKGAPKLINEFGGLEKAIEEAPNIKAKKQREGLMNNGDQALQAKKMVTIYTDVPNVVDWRELKWEGIHRKELYKFFRRMEFRSLSRKYIPEDREEAEQELSTNQGAAAPGKQGGLFEEETVTEGFDQNKVAYHAVESPEDLDKVVQKLSASNQICFDTETDSTDPLTAKLVGISLAIEPEEAWYIPIDSDRGLTEDAVFQRLENVFSDPDKLKIAHNLKYDFLVFAGHGLKPQGPFFDTMIAAYLLEPDQRLSMDQLSEKYLNYRPIPITELLGKKGKNQKTMDQIDIETVSPYACEDADITLRLYKILGDKLEKDELNNIAGEVEFPLIPVLAEMELNGVAIDQKMLGDLSEELKNDLQQIQQRIYELAGAEFNINSTQQLGDILFNQLKLPSGGKTRTGQYSTSEATLSKLAEDYEIARKVLDYRGLSKLKSTYVDALPKLINSQTGRVHTQFNQHIAATGRLSSSNPNLQNIPIRTERGREIRRAFTAEEGNKLLAADYSQVELRVIASMAGDEAMKEAFNNDEDIHARTAKEIFGLSDMEQVTPDQRRKAKEVNFGIPYGVSAYGLANRLGISNEEGKKMIDQYFARFPGIQTYIKDTIDFAKKHGYVKTLFGRRRYIPDIHARNWNVRSFAERTAINMPIQGTAADIIKMAMIRIQDHLKSNNLATRMLLQVHDELIFEVPEDELDGISGTIKELMEQAFDLGIPLKVEMGWADTWLDAH